MGSFYHVFNRGANRQIIFYEPENYDYFLRLFKSHSIKHQTGIICYCLMPNHFHFLLYQESEKTISKLMQGLLSAYTDTNYSDIKDEYY
jgi:putative transposase